MVGLVDCNNFFVSCERVFNPKLVGRPVVVLSNNDGCVIARSNEAKEMGIKMGEPFFRVRSLYESGNLEVRSGNLTLYRDMSKRVMSVVRRHVARIEVYSIDECFLDLEGVPDLQKLGRNLAQTIRKWTGIPVSVGIAPTKTLAKMASKFAKKYPGYQSCCLIDTDEKRLKALQLTPIADVWGVGRRHLSMLQFRGVKTAYDLTLWNETKVRNYLSLPGVRMWRELQGHPAIPLEPPAAKQSITTSRSFKSPITEYEELRSLIADFASLCTDKLRQEKSAARTITAYIRTDRFRVDLPQYNPAASISLDVATSDLREIISAATQCLKAIYQPGYGFKKAGVLLSDISHGSVQAHLFDQVDREKQKRLLEAIDQVRHKNGASALKVATQESYMKALNHEHRSPNFSTQLEDIIVVK